MSPQPIDRKLSRWDFSFGYNWTSWNLKWWLLGYVTFGVMMALIFESWWYLILGWYLGSFLFTRNAIARLTGLFLPELLITNAGWYTSGGRDDKDRAITDKYRLILVRDPLALLV